MSWIAGFGGDGAYAGAVYQLLADLRGSNGRSSVGRAIEVDVRAGMVGEAIAYLATPVALHIPPPADTGLTQRSDP
jgi:hypothetical protein